jgi:hypothetical protein
VRRGGPFTVTVSRVAGPGAFVVNASQGFRSFDGAWRTIQGYEVLHMIRKGQVRWLPKGDVLGQIQFIRELLGLKAEQSTDEIGGWFGFADRIVFAAQPPKLPDEDPVLRLRLCIRRTVALLRLGLVLAFLLLFLLQHFLLFRVFLLQLLRLLLMLLLYLLFFSLIRLLLRNFRVFLLLLLLDSLPLLFLLRAELILLLLVLPVQLSVRGGLYNGPWRSRHLIGMDGWRRSRSIGLRWLVHSTVRRAIRTVGGLYSVRGCRLVCRWIGIIGWRRPVEGSVWPRCVRRDWLRVAIR